MIFISKSSLVSKDYRNIGLACQYWDWQYWEIQFTALMCIFYGEVSRERGIAWRFLAIGCNKKPLQTSVPLPTIWSMLAHNALPFDSYSFGIAGDLSSIWWILAGCVQFVQFLFGFLLLARAHSDDVDSIYGCYNEIMQIGRRDWDEDEDVHE